MRPIDSQDSQGSDLPPAPYDDAGPAPPDYASPPLHQGEDDETPLILRDKKRQPGQGQPISVDDFAHEVSALSLVLPFHSGPLSLLLSSFFVLGVKD